MSAEEFRTRFPEWYQDLCEFSDAIETAVATDGARVEEVEECSKAYLTK